MSRSEALKWLRSLALGLLIMVVAAVGFWAQRPLRKNAQSAISADPILTLTPATYQTISRRLEVPRPGSRASELTWRWTYDTDGRLTQAIGPGGATTRITY